MCRLRKRLSLFRIIQARPLQDVGYGGLQILIATIQLGGFIVDEFLQTQVRIGGVVS